MANGYPCAADPGGTIDEVEGIIPFVRSLSPLLGFDIRRLARRFLTRGFRTES